MTASEVAGLAEATAASAGAALDNAIAVASAAVAAARAAGVAAQRVNFLASHAEMAALDAWDVVAWCAVDFSVPESSGSGSQFLKPVGLDSVSRIMWCKRRAPANGVRR